MKISYAITVCNEFEEIQKLIPFLFENKGIKDDIVVLFDQKNGSEEVVNYLRTFSKFPGFQFWRGLDFDGHFANWKNKLKEYCTGDYIFQIDADEIPNKILIDTLPIIIKSNPEVDVLLVPRVNTVKGLTESHIQKWGWNVDKEDRVNWPDYQMRVWKNVPEIKWENRVHEKIVGYKQYATIPSNNDSYALFHPKDIKRQEKQNAYCDTL